MGATQRYLMFVSYVGTGFWGSQLQTYQGCGAARETVQYVIENGLKHVFELTEERPIRVALASRTDTGVHALRAALSVSLPQFKGDFIKPDSLKIRLNRYFTNFRNVRILEVYNVPDSFKFRSLVLDKTYMYRYGLLKKEFSEEKYNYLVPVMEVDRTFLDSTQLEFDTKKAEEATALFEGKKDFGAIVGRPKHNTKPTVCNVMQFTMEPAQTLAPFDPIAQRYNYYNFTCKGDRFLYHMVRRMVCLTISVGFNLVTLKEIQKLFDEPVPSSWPRRVFRMVPGYGLYLVNINIDMHKISENQDEVIENKSEEIPSVAKLQ